MKTKTMYTQRMLAGFFILAFFIFAACEDDKTDKASVNLEFNTITSGFDLKSQMANSLEFTSGHILLESIELETDAETDSAEIDFELEGMVKIDYASGNPEPEIAAREIAPGKYTEMELTMALAEMDNTPSILIDGTWTDADGNTHPMQLALKSDQEFSLEKEGEINIGANTNMLAQITFNPQMWFIGVTNKALEDATANDDGVIVISEEQNTSIYETVMEGLDLASELEISM